MNIERTGDATGEPNKENIRVRNIELNDVPEVNNFVQEIQALPNAEKLQKVSNFIKSKFKSALPVNLRELPSEDQEKISKVFDQKTPKTLSECIELGYGVCLDYNALGMAIFNKLGIPAEFKVGSLGAGPKHTYLDIEVDGVWQIFDPFAEVYMQDRGSAAKLFREEYYTDSKTRQGAQ